MKRLFFVVVLLLAVVIVDTTYAETAWTKYAGSPVLDVGEPGAWDSYYLGKPFVINVGIYKMWYQGESSPSQWRIGFAESNDGITWTKYTGNPVLTAGESGTWDSLFAADPSVIKDGTIYRMWYSGSNGSQQKIGYAESADGFTWIKYTGNAVLDVGAPGTWDSASVNTPAVIFDGTIYKMWYGGSNGMAWGIGYAESTDGLTWTKYTGNPVLTAGASGTWDSASVNTPAVIFDGTIYKMWYLGAFRIGYAESTDGIIWTKYAGNPVLEVGEPWSWDSLLNGPNVILDGSTYKMWYAGFDGATWRIGYATASIEYTPVQIDIKPGSFPNAIKLKDSGVIPVAIFSASDFDVRNIDVATLRLNGGSLKTVGGKGYLASYKDVNGDGLLDLVVQFDSEKVQLKVGDTFATVTGVMIDGNTLIQGTDSVKVIE